MKRLRRLLFAGLLFASGICATSCSEESQNTDARANKAEIRAFRAALGTLAAPEMAMRKNEGTKAFNDRTNAVISQAARDLAASSGKSASEVRAMTDEQAVSLALKICYNAQKNQ